MDASGRVSVGTSNAGGAQFCVQGTTLVRTDGEIMRVNDAADSSYWFRLSRNGSDFEISNRQVGALAFLTSDIERLRITGSGLVGVGTSSPGYKLQANVAPSSSAIDGFSVNDGTANVVGLFKTGATFAYSGVGANQSWIYGGVGDLNITSDNTGVTKFQGIGGVNRMVIDSSGRVGVGNSNPSFNLDVSGGAGNGIRYLNTANSIGVIIGSDSSSAQVGSVTSHPVQFLVGAVERARLDTSGRLGIGNTVPISSVRLGVTATTNNARIAIQDSTANTWNGIANNNDKLQFERWNGSTWDVFGTFDNSGRLGIGTTSPSATLHVATNGNPEVLIGGTQTPILSFVGGAGSDPVVGYGVGALRFGTVTGAGAAGFSEKARLDTSGRLLVGTSSARSNVGQTNTPRVQIEGTSYADTILSLVTNAASTGSEPTLVLGKTRGGSIGSTGTVVSGDILGSVNFEGSDGSKLITGAYIRAEVDNGAGGTAVSANECPARLLFSTTADGASSPTERMRILSTGSVLFSTDIEASITSATANGHMWYESAQSWASSRSTTGGASHFVFYNPNGVVGTIQTSASATSYNTSSDYRLKENVTAVTDGITRLQQLKPSRFNFKADPSHTVDGFIAHEAQAVVPECVTGAKDAVDADGKPVYQGIDQSKLVPLLTAALQEAIAKIESLEARLAAAGI